MVFSIFWKAVVLIDLECHWGGGGGVGSSVRVGFWSVFE